MSKAITVKTLRDEVNLERWDRKGVRVKAWLPSETEAYTEFEIVGIYNDRDDALVLELAKVEAS